MKARTVGLGVMLLSGVVPFLTAQNIPGNPSRTGNPEKTEDIKVSDEIKVTGCLLKNGNGLFQVKNGVIGVTPWMTPKAQKHLGVAGPMKSDTTVDLKSETDLESHLGHSIEVTGVLEPGSANTPPTPDTIGGPGGTTGIPAGGVARFDRPRLLVKSLRDVSSTCP